MKEYERLKAFCLSFSLSTTLAFGQAVFPKPLIVPLLDDEGSIRVPVTLFGQTNFFIVDTGSSHTALDIRFQDRLGTAVRKIREHALFRSPNILLGETPIGLKEVFCTDLSKFRLITGEPCDGILGMDFLGKHVIEVDFDQNLLSVGAEVPQQIKQSAQTVPLALTNKLFFTVPAVLNGKLPLNLMIDSGSGRTLSLNPTDWKHAFPPNEHLPIHRLFIAGVGKEITQSRVGHLRSLEIAGQSFSNAVCALSAMSTVPSSIGVRFLRRYLVTVDGPNHRLYLRQRTQTQNEEELDMSGLHILRRDEVTFVHSVDEGSPAANAGVRAGDGIASINGVDSRLLEMKHIRRILKLGPGEKISLVINHDGRAIDVEFNLKRFL